MYVIKERKKAINVYRHIILQYTIYRIQKNTKIHELEIKIYRCRSAEGAT